MRQKNTPQSGAHKIKPLNCHHTAETGFSYPSSQKKSGALRQASRLDRARLPLPAVYFASIALKLYGTGEWQSALCPFHDDHHPSLRVHRSKGCFKCFACGAQGGDIIDFYRQLNGVSFVEAVKALGAWQGGQHE